MNDTSKPIHPQPATIMVRNPNNPMETAPVMVQAGGMTLREYYAGQILCATIAAGYEIDYEEAVAHAERLISWLGKEEPPPLSLVH